MRRRHLGVTRRPLCRKGGAVTQPPPPHPADQRAPIALGEFVSLVAALMALGALGVDAMLPSLPTIGRELGATDPNAPQFVISIYLIGLGIGQLIHGPAADHFGRRPVMLTALAVYAVANLAATLAHSFVLLLAVRFIGAVAAAATRVVTIAIVRDCYSGRQMARVMSLAAMVFMIFPVLAPTLGQGVLLIGSWRLIFGIITAATVLVMAWFWWRLPETIDPATRAPFSARRMAGAAGQALGDRWSLGYMMATTGMQGALFGYITSVQQIVGVTFGRPALLNVAFAGGAGAMAIANLVNSRLVLRVGSRVLSQSALIGMIGAGLAGLALDTSGHETLILFIATQAVASGCFSLANSNFSALAMTNMGAIAGTASSIQGFVAVTGGALIGSAIGQAFAGTAAPLHAGFLVAGVAAFAIVAVTERGRMFRPG